MDWNITTIAAAAVAISAPFNVALGVLLTKGVDAIVRLRKSKTDNNMEVAKHEDAQAKEAYAAAMVAHEKLNSQFESRVKALEDSLKSTLQELKQTRDEHTKCQVEQEKLRGDLKALQVHVDRLWSHDKANKDNLDGLKKTLESKLADSGEATVKQ